MATQMIIRLEPSLKEKVSRLARSEGKNLSELVRELLENYTKERDLGLYIDNLWDSIGNKLSKNDIEEPDIEKAIRQVRSQMPNKVVIDTNVFVSSFFGGIPREIINLWKDGHIILCLSQDIVEEYLQVLNRLGLNDENEIIKLTKLFSEGHNSVFTATTPTLLIVKEDPDDNKFIECAVALDCKIIISGDKHLKNIKKYIDIKILSPKEFIVIFQSE